MADMGPSNRRRERKRDQDDRRSQNSHDLWHWHDGSVVAQAPLDIAGEPGVQGPRGGASLSAIFFSRG
jgi:hypothetical protein